MRFLCYGSGAVGSLIGGRLALAGYEVSLVGRERTVLPIMEHGLIVEMPDGTSSAVKIPAYLTLHKAISDSGIPDILVLSVKSYDTKGTVQELSALPESVKVLTLQNGIGNEESLAAALGAERVIAGALTLSVSMPEPRLVRQNTVRGGLALAPVAGTLPDVSAFVKSGFETAVAGDYRAVKWSKLLLNIVANATCAVLEMTPNEVFAEPRLVQVEQAAVREASRVMAALGVKTLNLPGFNVGLHRFVMTRTPALIARALIGPRLAKARGDKPPSLLLDMLSEKRRSEVMYLNGAVEKKGRELGIPAPVNSVLTRLLVSICENPSRWTLYRKNPDALMNEIRST